MGGHLAESHLKPDRRAEQRYTASLVAQIVVADFDCTLADARVVDISEGGLAFRSPRAFPDHTEVTVECRGCTLLGQVRHTREREYASETEYIVGVQVGSIAEGENIWRVLVEEHCAN